MKFEDKRILIVGAGKSGIAAANLLANVNVKVILYDGNSKTDVHKLRELLSDADGVDIVIGEFPINLAETIDLVVLSPGVPTDLEFIVKMEDMGIPVWGEIELAYAFSKGLIVGITGTNGKTTTTALTGQILREYYKKVFVVGNIGIPYTQMANEMTEDSVTAIELSSFQLETIHSFVPDVSMILNITPDHLDRHYTMENYIVAKKKIAMNQGKNQTCVLNYEDDVLRKFADDVNCKVLFFSSKRKLENGLYLSDGVIYYNDGNNTTSVVKTEEMNIIGIHNYENAMAAIGAALALNIPIDCINKAVREFKAVEHRIEYVATKKGVKYYNDSKGTNPDAAIKGIKAMQSDTVLIGGGYDKDSEFDEWIESFDGKVKKLILIGQTAHKIAQTCDKLGFKDYEITDTLENAMNIAKDTAIEGDCVLLSPACASWGMFKNYEERGRIFKDIVNEMEE